eukprot:scaffold460_cov81-Skeletonema_menzelii.AAC.12
MEQIRSSGMFSGWRAIGGAVSDVMVVCVCVDNGGRKIPEMCTYSLSYVRYHLYRYTYVRKVDSETESYCIVSLE